MATATVSDMSEIASILHMTALMRTLTIDENGVTISDGCKPPMKKRRKIRVLPEAEPESAPAPAPATAVAVAVPVKKKRKLRIVPSTDGDGDGDAESISTAQSSTPKKEVPVQTMPPKRASAKTSIQAPVEDRVVMVHVTSFEKEMNQLPVVDVETVRLVLLEHAGKTYYHDPNKHKLYTRTGAKSVGAYVGRWDPRRECICTDVHDSDADA
jgi:hypothetical protein